MKKNTKKKFKGSLSERVLHGALELDNVDYFTSGDVVRIPKKKVLKFAYIQNWGTYSNETVVAIGMSHKDILEYLKRIKAKKEVIENFENAHYGFSERVEQGVGGIAHIDYQTGTTIIMFPIWENNWKWWDSLLHEITHLVHAILGKNKNMMDEDEARAYQTEYLFREIRRKLWKKIN